MSKFMFKNHIARKVILVVLSFACSSVFCGLVSAQTQGTTAPVAPSNSSKPSGASALMVVDEMPEFPGGQAALLEFLRKNLTYPALARDNKVQGRVVLSFIVGVDGTISNISVVRSLSSECDAEATRVVSQMPKWTPGKQNGEPVRVQFNLPIQFTMRQSTGISALPSGPSTNGTLVIAESMPEFPGGQAALLEFLRKNLTYPALARDNKVQGRVLLSFVVDKDGSIMDPKVLRSVSVDCDAEALRVLRMMPKWKPGMNKGEVVKVQFVLPINFALASKNATTDTIQRPTGAGKAVNTPF